MKQTFLYALTLAVGVLLTYLAEFWFGTEWLFGLLTVGLFALFLQGWKRWGTNGGGLIIVTVFLLISLDSIFFVQYFPAFIASLLMGVLLLPHYHKNRDGIVSSAVFVLLNMLISLEFVPNELMLWLIVLAAGTAAVIGFRFNLNLVRKCFIALFAFSAFFLLLFEIFDGSNFLAIIAILLVGFFITSMYRLNKHVAA